MSNSRASYNSLVVNQTGADANIPVSTISATGSITGGSFITAGNVTAGNIRVGGDITATGGFQVGNLRIAGTISATGTIYGGNLALNSGALSAGNIISAGPLSAQTVSILGNVTGGNIRTVGQVTATGNIAGNYFIGNGSQLTGVAGSSNAALLTGTGLSGNVISSQLRSVGILSQLSVTGTITGGNLISNGSAVVLSAVNRTIWVSNVAPQSSQGAVGDIWYQTF